MSAELAERSTTQGNQVLGFYYGLEYHHSSHFTVPSYVKRITANFKNILGHQAIVVQINNNLIGETKKLFVDVRYSSVYHCVLFYFNFLHFSFIMFRDH